MHTHIVYSHTRRVYLQGCAMGHRCLNILWLLATLKLSLAQPPVSPAVFVPGYSRPISSFEYTKFSQGGYFISKLNFVPNSTNIVIGSADVLYVLHQNLSLITQLNLPASTSSVSACSAAVGYNPEYVCRNHLRVFSSSPNDPTKLMVCGSEAAGTPSCRAVDISTNTSYNASTLNGLVSIRPDFYGSGVSYNVTNPRNITFFTVSTLNLNATNTGLFFFSVSYTNSSDPNSLCPMLQLRTNSVANFRAPVFVDTYVANYAPRTAILPGVMDTISPDEHKYFFVFLRDSSSNGTTISQVVRVCQNDPGNSTDKAPLTLVKARINCISTRSSTNYNGITAVAFNEMGRYYQNGDWAKFMYGVFFTSVNGVPVSAVCVYPANNSVDDTTDANGRNGGVFDIFRTLLMNPNTGKPTTSGYVECTDNGNNARPDYTYTDTILSITQIGSEPLATITGVTVTNISLDQTCVVTNNATVRICVIQDVLFLGTATGTILKVAMGYSGTATFPVISEEIKLDDTSSVRKIEVQQQSQGGPKYLYVNTDTSIYRIPVQRCSKYSTCSACVGSRDPYCVWNTSLSQCVVFSNNSGSASVPNGIYQNIHTGVANCPVNSVSLAPTTSLPGIKSTIVILAPSSAPIPAVTSAAALPMTPVSSSTTLPTTPPTMKTTTPTMETTPPTTPGTGSTETIIKQIFPGTPSIAIIAVIGGLCVVEFFVILTCCACCCAYRRRRMPNPEDPSILYRKPEGVAVIQNTNAGSMDLDDRPLMRNVDRNSVLYRSESVRSDTDGPEFRPQFRAPTQDEKIYDQLIKPNIPTIPENREGEFPDTSLTAI